MRIVEYRDRLPDLARLANRHLGLLTPGWELTARQLASALRNPLQYGPYFREEPQPGATEVICVMDHERLVAAAALWLPDRSDRRWSDGRLPRDGRDEAELLWLLSDPGAGGGLRTLLEEAAGRAARLGCRRITAGDGCGVCPARYGVPASWAHLGAGLEEHGFAVTSQSAMMHARLTDLDDEAPADDGLTLVWREDPEVPEWELAARVGTRQVGECLAWGLSRHLADHPEYRRWMIVEWIEVAESHRRQGIGRRLIFEQMRAHAKRDGTDALLQVHLPDPDAARFHEAMGFSAIETGSTYRKDGLQGTDR